MDNTIILNVQTNTATAESSLKAVVNEINQMTTATTKSTEAEKTSTQAINDNKKATDSLASSQAKIVTFADKITAGFESVKKAITMNSKFQELNAGLDLISKSFSFVTGIINSFKDTIMEMETKSTMKSALRGLSNEGEDLNKVLSQTLEITKGVSSGGAIQAQVNTLMTQGFGLTEDALRKLIDVSGIYSSVTGQDMNAVMQKLAMGSQRERDMIFEKMGVVIKSKEELEKYSLEIGKNVDQMSEAEKSNRLLTVAVDGLKEKFNEAGISASSLESPMSTVFNTMSANAKKVKYEIVDFFSQIVGEILFVKRMNEENNQAFFQGELNAALAKTLKANKELSAEYVRQIELTGGKLTDTQIEYYKKRYLLDKEEEQSRKVISKETIQRIKDEADIELGIKYRTAEGEVKILNARKMLHGEFIENTKEYQNVYKEKARLYLTDVELATLGSQKINKEIKKTAKDGTTYVKNELMNFAEMVNLMGGGTGADASIFTKFFKPPEQLDTAGTIKAVDELYEAGTKEAVELEQIRQDKIREVSAKSRTNKVQEKYDILQKPTKEKEVDLTNQVTGMYDRLNKVTTDNSKIRLDEQKLADKEEIDLYKANAEIKFDLLQQQLDYEQEIRDDANKYELKQKEEKEKRSLEIQQMGQNVFNAAANSLYNDLISGQEDFLQRAAAIALQTAGSQIFADGLAMVWKGGAKLISSFGTIGWADVAYGTAEMGVGVALGYAGNKVMPKSESQGSSATETNKTNQNNMVFNLQTSLYGSKKEAQKELNGIMR